jgi:small subunit ribosomal protein S5
VGTTIPHEVIGEYRSSRVLLLPAKPGSGVIAGECVRSVVEAAGVTDILTKAYGSTNPLNLVKATFDALSKLRTREQIERLRGVTL